MKTRTLGKKLFVATGSLSDVVLNWYGEPTEKFDSYARAYHSAASRLFKRSSPAELRDDRACPVVFLYRHSLELYLKEIPINGQKILRLEGMPFRTVKEILRLGHNGHNLWVLWSELKDLYKQIDWDWDKQLDACSKIIKDFNRVDPRSFSFRYPVTKNANPALKGHFRFDLGHFCKQMDEVLEKLDEISCGIACMLDQMIGNQV
jgi:hypothetical protein